MTAAGLWRPSGSAVPSRHAQEKEAPTLGTIERLDARLDAIVPSEARVERIAEGFDWSEGPVWDRERGIPALLRRAAGTRSSSGRRARGSATSSSPADTPARSPAGGEPGSNGLVMDPQGRLVLCQHGDRRVARLERRRQDLQDPGRPVQGQAVQQPQRRRLQLQGRPLLHRPALRPAQAERRPGQGDRLQRRLPGLGRRTARSRC